MRRTAIFTLFAGISLLAAQTAGAGSVGEQFGSGAFGLPWNASKTAVEGKYPGGKWDQNEKGLPRYCAPSKQMLLKLPAQYQTQELCFLIGQDSTLASVTARMEPTLPALLAVVNRSRTMFGDFDAVRRDEGAIQSRHTNMLWIKDAPLVVQVSSGNDPDGRPNEVSFTVSDEASLYTAGAAQVSNKPTLNR
jgi:hypothetical protein